MRWHADTFKGGLFFVNKFVCIHGHFYQPPRENPWLEEVEIQESARPYHDWNERISAECYARNGASRILDNQGLITEVVNNYSKISFNIGPTLLSWMERKDPQTYQMVLEADRLSRERFSGHGSAMAQVYNHMIMPLASSRDKRTQVIWGIRDFEYRFERKPEGMWLAEAAVDLESLDIMAEQGIKFTVLAPHQAKRAKKIDDEREWEAEDEEQIDLRRPYLCRLPSGRTIAIFFYDGPISQSVAFEGLLHNGEAFARRIMGALDMKSKEPQFVHIATDGESYGHHHKFGDMALAYCLKHIEESRNVRLSVYGEFLEKNPPLYEVEIVENSSWSCIHGIERWRDNCGCASGGKPAWNQEWRTPLRESLDWLRDRAATVYEQEMRKYHPDPWGLRDAYIEVVLDRNRYNIERFLTEHISRPLEQPEKTRVLRCLEIQRNALLMYTSCGWFFDDISGIETVQIIKYAARVIQLVRRLTQEDLELGFIERLGRAKSNVPEANNGARIYKNYVEPSIVDIQRVGAHYAITSLYQDYPKDARLYSFMVRRHSYERQSVGKMEVVVGQAEITSEITLTAFMLQFAVIHLGDHNFICGVDHFNDEASFRKMYQDMLAVFTDGDIPRALLTVNRYFGTKNYSLWHLFKQEQERILEKVFDSTMNELEGSFRRIYDEHFSLIRMLNENQLLLPKALANIVEFVLCRDMVRLFEEEDLPLDRLARLAGEMKRWQFKRDKENLDYIAGGKVLALMERFAFNTEDIVVLEGLVRLLEILLDLGFEIDMWKPQNIYFHAGRRLAARKRQESRESASARRWVEAFEKLGNLLKVKMV
jgi:alpha-amylase/alpha-mannosidase (GH57 family)